MFPDMLLKARGPEAFKGARASGGWQVAGGYSYGTPSLVSGSWQKCFSYWSDYQQDEGQ